MNRALRAATFAGAAALSIGLFFRVALSTRFGQLWGNDFDGGIEAAILEHWYNVFRGVDTWNATQYFYPQTDTLGYNDGYFLYGVMHAVFRWAGADVFVASALVDMTVKGIGFGAMFVCLRRVMACRFGYALFGAALFTLAHGSFVHSIHQQLLSVAFAPLLAWWAWEAWRALAEGRLSRFVLWGAGAGLLWGAWLLTAYYMAWFAALFGCVLALVGLPVMGWSPVRSAARLCWAHRWHCAAVGVVAGLAVVPFLVVYLPKLKETGGQSWQSTLYFTPRLNDIVNLGPTSLLWGPYYGVLCRACSRGEFEFTTGITPILMWLFVAAALWLCIRRVRAGERGRPLLLATALSVVVLLLLVVRWRSHTAWWFVWTLVPGASGVRVISRLLLFLVAPLIAVVVPYLQNLSGRAPRHLVVLLAALVLMGQGEPGAPMYNRQAGLAHLVVPAPPAGCKAFYVTATDTSEIAADVYRIYPHNVQAMLLSELLGLPTINGYSTFESPDWDFADPLRPDYEARVHAYAARHDIGGLCRLDLKAHAWTGPER